MGFVSNLYNTLYSGLSGERFESGTYEYLCDFVKHENHGGLYLLKVDVDTPWIYDTYLNFLTGKAKTKSEQFLPLYQGKHIGDVPFEALNTHSVIGDGAIAVNRKGIVMDDHRVVRRLFPERVCEEAQYGTGHISMASVSLWPRVSAYICSHEQNNTVKKFKMGKLDPHKEYRG